MTSRQKNRFSLILIGVVVLASLAIVGCSDNGMVEEPTADTSQPQLLNRSSKAVASSMAAGEALYKEAVISDATGGELKLYDVTLEVPAGAVGNDTLFSINIPDAEVFFNEFGTHGLVFNKPVKVTMSYRDADLSGVDESTIRIAWLDERDGLFKDIQCDVDTDAKTVTGYLNHFSAYGLVSD